MRISDWSSDVCSSDLLNFSAYISSEKPINKANGDRTDITIFNNRVAFRGENEASNPITIFEFKKPQRDDFANPSSKDDPVQQIVRYVNQIRDGKFKTPKNRDILVNANTPLDRKSTRLNSSH